MTPDPPRDLCPDEALAMTDAEVETLLHRVRWALGEKTHDPSPLPMPGQGVRDMRTLALLVSAFRSDVARLESELAAERGKVAEMRPSTPVPMVLHCPRCGWQHIDRPNPKREWDNPPHRSHECQSCFLVWRPADVPTTGVESVTTVGSRDDSAEEWTAAATIANPPTKADQKAGG